MISIFKNKIDIIYIIILLKNYIQYTMKKKKLPPTPLVIPNKPMDLEKLMNYRKEIKF